MRTKLACFMTFVIIVAVLISSCTPTQSPDALYTPTSTSRPSQTPEPTLTPGIYTIPADNIALDSTVECTTSVTVLEGNNSWELSENSTIATITLADGTVTLDFWCPGAIHTWQGTFGVFGYLFSSDESDPLTFVVKPDGSYQYVSGSGWVTDLNSHTISLP